MLMVRGLMSLAFIFFLVGGRAKYILYECTPRAMVAPLALRTFFGITSFFLSSYAIMHLPIFIVALIVNTAPIFVSIIAYLALGERLNVVEIVCLLMAFFGVALLFA